ncbi:SDR family NAD(P)-dependent oxidoreductase [Nocardia sp. alder85J]|uniref:SDR family NAD(P)-dependent oxidoreductase n=1 Tax=Nocardia sp. alder85J TaxID=2862949 RepID=UPI001CD3DDCC|nr:SDR family oxidoreductase [Nocardia sp. alder85J]MCX4098449.1 SDR family NAD(P)-dependent oxidoreductase [Nocardia sp. alder85J]
MRNAHTTVVVGASRGLGRGIATAFAADGGSVVAVARDESRLAELAAEAPGIRYDAADAGEKGVAERLLEQYEPDTVVLVAGAIPHVAPLEQQTWETFSVNWETDVRIAFLWLSASLLRPLRPGSRVIVVSSGAAVGGSPLSGGYAGAKATQRFITAYANGESARAGLGIDFTTVLPRPVPGTGVGQAAVDAYATPNGLSAQQYAEQLGGLLTPETVGAAVVELAATEPADLGESYLLTAAGLNRFA